MREVRVESLENLEVVGGEARLRIASENLEIVFSKDVWNEISRAALSPEVPSDGAASEVEAIREELGRLAAELRFTTIMEAVQTFDLVLRSSDLYAVTTGYVFAKSEVGATFVRDIRRALASDDFVEQTYIVCPSATDEAFAGCDDDTRVVSVRGRRSSVSRFEMAPELWRTLSAARGWSDVNIAHVTDTNQRQEV